MGQESNHRLQAQRGIWGAREIGGARKWKSLGTRDKEIAEAKFRSEYGEALLPEENQRHSEIAKAHLNLVDPNLTARTWGDLQDLWAKQKHIGASTKERRSAELERGVFPIIRDRKICDRTVEAVIVEWQGRIGVFARNALRQMQNLAIDVGWMLNPMIKPIYLKVRKAEKKEVRPIKLEEHLAILEREQRAIEGKWPITYSKNSQEKHDYYLMLWLTGAAQIDAANLTRANVDMTKKVLHFVRQKTNEDCKIRIEGELAKLIKRLPKSGKLFPTIATWESKHRAAEFYRRTHDLGIEGVSLHSYRYAMAEKCVAVGMPMRYAQEMPGHPSKAVATAYAKKADVIAPTPEGYAASSPNVVDGLSLVAA